MTHTPRGFTLPELLIALSLSLGLIAAALKLYGVSRQSSASLNAAQAVHDNARLVLNNLRLQAQLASGAYLLEIDGPANTELVQLSPPHSATTSPVLGSDGGANKSDLVLSDYQLNSKKELTCRDSNANTKNSFQALAEGVEDLQVRYAVFDAHRLQWRTASASLNAAQVLAVEVCVRVASLTPVSANASASQGCNGERIAADGYVRRVFRRAWALRSRLESAS
jgi:prepilin-type N-terminal cleavage/methylation domain-containing protein